LYPAELAEFPHIKDSSQWQEFILKPQNAHNNIPILKVTTGPFKIGQESGRIEDLFSAEQIEIVKKIWKISGLELLCQKTYANLSKKKKAHAQLHPCEKDIDIAIREVDEKCPKCKFLKEKAIPKLFGYQQITNRGWLEGIRKTSRPAIAFTLNLDLMKDPSYKGWGELEKLLEYARQK
jgi:hypothetical protein